VKDQKEWNLPIGIALGAQEMQEMSPANEKNSQRLEDHRWKIT